MATAYGGSYRSRDEGDDFDEYDPTPYGGGYDLFLTFGRPLPPSDETCYPCSAPSTSYEAPHYSADEPSPYVHHSKPQPAYGFRPQQEQQPQQSYGGDSRYGSKPQPAYGFRPTAPATGPSPSPRRRTPTDLGTAGSRSRRRATAPAMDPGTEGSSSRRRATGLGIVVSRRPWRATGLGTVPATGGSRRWSRATDRSMGLGTEGSRRWRRAMDRGMGAGRRGERSMVVVGMGGRLRRRAMVPRGMAMEGRLRRRAMVVLGMDMGRRRRKTKARMALVGTLSQSRMGRRLRVHMVTGMERRSPNIRVVGMRSRAMAGERNTRGAMAARSMMTTTLILKRRNITRSTTIVATSTMTKHPFRSWSAASTSISSYCVNKNGALLAFWTLDRYSLL